MTTISRDSYLKALGLFTLATDYYRQMQEAENKVAEILGLEEGSHVADAIYTDGGGSVRDFDEALKRQKITVEAS